MPRVKHVQSARKPIPSAGVEVGDSYYWWKFRHGPKRVSKTYPKRSQLTQSLWSSVYAAQEELEKAPPDEVLDAAQNVVSEAESARDDYESAAEAFNNEGSNQERYEAAESFVEQAESLVSDIESYLDDLKELEWKGERVWYSENEERLLDDDEIREQLSEWVDQIVELELEY